MTIERHDQCVSPSGFSCSVACTISSTFSEGIEGLRPRPGRIGPNNPRPSVSNRPRQLETVVGETPTSAPIRVFATPSPVSNSARARCTSRCFAVRDRASFSSSSGDFGGHAPPSQMLMCRWSAHRRRPGRASRDPGVAVGAHRLNSRVRRRWYPAGAPYTRTSIADATIRVRPQTPRLPWCQMLYARSAWYTSGLGRLEAWHEDGLWDANGTHKPRIPCIQANSNRSPR